MVSGCKNSSIQVWMFIWYIRLKINLKIHNEL